MGSFPGICELYLSFTADADGGMAGAEEGDGSWTSGGWSVGGRCWMADWDSVSDDCCDILTVAQILGK